MAQVLGMISSFLGIVAFGINHMPRPVEKKTTVRVGVGLDVSGGLNEAGGDVPDIWLWNEAAEFIGVNADPGNVDDGSFYDVTVDQGDNGQQAPYLLMSGNDDAVCIAYASMTWADGSKYGWVGDWGELCGGAWYYSNIYWDNKDYKPLCSWVDKNGDQPVTGISMHIPAFNTKDDRVPKNVTKDTFCGNQQLFQLHYEPDPTYMQFVPITNTPPPAHRRHSVKRSASHATAANKKKAHSSKARAGASRQRMAEHLIMSKDAQHHSTERLCSSPTSQGPDFVNVAEGQYCRMSDKTLWPVCRNRHESDNCFNLDTQDLVVSGISARGGVKYAKVIQWD